MIQKRLADLNIDELKSEFGNAGISIQGDFTESLALVKLTIYLVSSGEDPFTFLFNIPLEKVAEDRNMNESKFEDEASEDLPSERPVDSGLGSADGVSAGSLNSEILPSTLSSFVMALESSVTSTGYSSREFSYSLPCSEINGDCFHLAHCWSSCSEDMSSNYKVEENWQGCSLSVFSSSGSGSCSCCYFEKWAVNTQVERPNVWPLDFLSVSHHWEWWDVS